jgi:hypothetical protein
MEAQSNAPLEVANNGFGFPLEQAGVTGPGHLPTFPSVGYLELEISLMASPGSRQSPPAEQCPLLPATDACGPYILSFFV